MNSKNLLFASLLACVCSTGLQAQEQLGTYAVRAGDQYRVSIVAAKQLARIVEAKEPGKRIVPVQDAVIACRRDGVTNPLHHAIVGGNVNTGVFVRQSSAFGILRDHCPCRVDSSAKTVRIKARS